LTTTSEATAFGSAGAGAAAELQAKMAAASPANIDANVVHSNSAVTNFDTAVGQRQETDRESL
jgi:hypothetical protein